jgi:Ca2+-binding RTX toxin-like protein
MVEVVNIRAKLGLNLRTPLTPAPSGTGVVTYNTIFGGEVGESIYGLSGNDFLTGGGGADTIDGGTGSDLVYGGAEADFLNGGDGNDFLLSVHYSVRTGRQLKGEGDSWVNWGVPAGRVIASQGDGLDVLTFDDPASYIAGWLGTPRKSQNTIALEANT